MKIKDIVEELSDKKADEFHTKLDKLVHDYIGHSSDEEKEKAALKKGNSEEVEEAAKKISKDEDPCWSGYKMVGTKKKNGKEVPNCVPGKKGE